MALRASSPPSKISLSSQQLNENLDAEITRIRAEIQSLTKRKQLLASSLVSSTKIQSYLSERNNSQYPLPIDNTPLRSQAQHNESNIHRLAYGVTSFPFTDPNPDTSDKPLLAVRFDIPSRSGRFEKAPYYIFLKRIDDNGSKHVISDSDATTNSTNEHLQIHHHTIPALVPLQDYEAKYLPQPSLNTTRNRQRGDEGYFSPSSVDEQEDTDDNHGGPISNDSRHDHDAPAQDLHALVAAVRHDLTSWHLRTDAITLLASQLQFSNTTIEESGHEVEPNNTGKHLLQSLQSTAADARFCRLVWQNGTVGRLRITDDGHIDRAVVIGDVGSEQSSGRLRDLERVLSTGKGGRRLEVMDLPERLEQVARRMNQEPSEENSDDGHRDSMDMDGSGEEEHSGVNI